MKCKVNNQKCTKYCQGNCTSTNYCTHQLEYTHRFSYIFEYRKYVPNNNTPAPSKSFAFIKADSYEEAVMILYNKYGINKKDIINWRLGGNIDLETGDIND